MKRRGSEEMGDEGSSASQASTESTSADAQVVGERSIPSVNRVRSLQSRVSSALAMGLVVAIGLGFLGWYYTVALTRDDRARDAAARVSNVRAQADMTVPPLGPIERPWVVPAEDSIADRSLIERVLGEPPPPPPNSEATQVYSIRGSTAARPQQTASELALKRRLAGAVFVTSSRHEASGESSRERTSMTATGLGQPEQAGGSQGLDQLLASSVLSSTQGSVLPSRTLLLPKGTFVDCTLETAIDTGVAGFTTCITATDTFGANGQVVLLERGTKLIGETRGQVQPGSSRIFVVWTEARTPAGVVVPLQSPGTDELGRAGLPGRVDRHFFERFGAALLISIIDGAIEAATQRDDGGVVINPSTSSQILTEVLRQTIRIPPTVLKDQGDRIQVLAARDIDFRGVYALRLDK